MRLQLFPVLLSALVPLLSLYPFSQTEIAREITVAQLSAERTERLRTEIQQVEGILPQIGDRGAGLYFLAKRYAQLGEARRAIALLKQVVPMDAGFDLDAEPVFESLKSSSDFEALAAEARKQYRTVHSARVAFTIAEKDLFPEGLAVDPERHVFYMGSMHQKKILKITLAGVASDFVKEGVYDLMPVGGVHVAADHSVWAATDPGEKNRSELVHFDSNGKLLERYPAPGPGPHCLNDLVIRNSHEIYATDSFGNHVYRFDLDSHKFSELRLPRPIFGPNGITVSGDPDLLYFADDLGVMVVDLRDGNANNVDPGSGTTLAGIDGLYWYKGSLVGLQYGISGHRIVEWHLSSDGRKVAGSRVLEYKSDLLTFPTTGAILGENLYFMANTGIGNLNDDKIVDPSKLEPIHIAVVHLK